MRPDLKRERRNSWLVLAGAAAICFVSIGWYAYDDDRANQLERAKAEHDRLHGPELMSVHVDKQQKANKVLTTTIEDLKHATGFHEATYFTITDDDRRSREHDNSIWKHKFDHVLTLMEQKAHDLGLLDWDENRYLGFPHEKALPSDAEIPYLLTMMQLSWHAVRICLFSDTAVGADPPKLFRISHDPTPPKASGPAGRPPLMYEYPMKIEVTGSLKEVMWILYRLSNDQPDASDPLDPTGGYPLVLLSLDIKSKVPNEITTPTGRIMDVDATFTVAGLRFIDQQKRGGAVIPAPWPGAAHAAGPSRSDSHVPAVSDGAGARP